jgi:hypothetical protein
MNELMHLRPLLRAAHTNRNASCLGAAIVASEGARAVGQRSVQKVTQGGGVGCIKKGGKITDERVEREAAVRPGWQMHELQVQAAVIGVHSLTREDWALSE